jgi:hypothetical protein
MQRLILAIVIFLLLFLCQVLRADSIFHTLVTDLNPPYFCKLKLTDAKGVSIEPKREYNFRGVCSVKLPIGNTWIYQNIWVELTANWDDQIKSGTESTLIVGGDGNRGNVQIALKCDNDPWLTKAQCVIDSLQNNTNFSNFGKIFNPHNGLYPPFEIITGQYPPLARNQAILHEAIAFSVMNAEREAAAAHQAFQQAFGPIGNGNAVNNQTMTPITPRKRRQIYKKPRFKGYRVDCCLKLNQDCGKPAADMFCQSMGYSHATNCKIDNSPCMPTYIMGNHTICNRSFCKGFDEVECAD